MKIAVGSTIVLLVMLLAWLIFERTSLRQDSALLAAHAEKAEAKELGRTFAVETQPSADARRVELDEAAPAVASGTGIQAHTLSVRSSIGLVLPFIEWQVNEIDWQRIDLDHGRCEIGPMKLPCLVRAPGHVAASASKAGEELVLEPDALLVLEASELRNCTSWIRPDDAYDGADAYGNQDWDEARMRPALRRAIACGWISDRRWALAVSSELVPEALHADPVESVVRWRDGRRADIYFLAKAGARGSWTVPCEHIASSERLEVRVIRPDTAAAGRVSLKLVRTVRGSSDAATERHEWGYVLQYDTETMWQNVMVPESADRAHFDSVPMGTRLSLAARDETTSAYGRLVFVHDGTARTIQLRSAFEVTGRAVSSSPSTPVATMDWWWKFREGTEDVWGWNADERGLVLSPDGRFSLRGPIHPLIRQDASLDPPSHLLLHVDAPGFESFEKLFDTGGATRFDCGEILLVPRRGEIVLAPGHGLTPKALRWNELRLSAAPEVWWSVRDGALMHDGGLEIFLGRSEKQPTLFDTSLGEPRAWPESPSERMLIHVLLDTGDEPWAFERGADGRYVAVPRRQFEAEVECRAMPSEGKSWYLGWQWHEIWDGCAQVPAYELGQTIRVHFSFPAEGATLYWSASGDPPHAGNEPGGSIPIEAMSGKLVLQ